jgi:hypothetical protein
MTIKKSSSFFIINVFKQIQYYNIIFEMNNQESYQLVIQMENLLRMFNNLSNRMNNIEDIVRNTRDMRGNTNTNQQRQVPLIPNQRQHFQTHVNTPPFTYNNPETTLHNPTPRVPFFPTTHDHISTYNTTDTTNLRRAPIHRQPITRTNTNTTNVTGNRPTQNLPTLHQPHVTRSYNSDGLLDTVEMTFTNMIDPDHLSDLLPNSYSNNNSPTPTRRSRNSRLINSPDDAQVFLNLLNTLSTSPRRQLESRSTIQDINRHTSVSSYIHTDTTRTGDEEGEEEGDIHTSNICAICRAPFEERDVTRTLNNCGHYFHCSCIDNWLEIRDTCPSCRHIINEPETIENNTPTIPNINTVNTRPTINGLD